MIRYVIRLTYRYVMQPILNYALYRKFWNLPKPRHNECIVLLNGPSFLEIKNDIIDYTGNADLITVNGSLTDEDIKNCNPIAHVLADPAFFSPHKSINHRQLDLAIKAISSINFKMNLIVPYEDVGKINLINSNITVSGFPKNDFLGIVPKYISSQFADIGIWSCGAQGVVIVALYLALACGYKKIWLAGCDEDIITRMKVDQHNNVYFNHNHFYNKNGDLFSSTSRVKDEFLCNYQLHCQFEKIKEYAYHKKSEIINLSPQSWCDTFPKGKLGQGPYP